MLSERLRPIPKVTEGRKKRQKEKGRKRRAGCLSEQVVGGEPW